MKLLGYKKSDFDTKDGAHITGFNIYVSEDIDPRKGKGIEVQRNYLSDAKIARENIHLDALLGKKIKIYYTRYGKIDSIVTEE